MEGKKMASNYYYWDDLSVAAAEVRDAMKEDFSEGALEALKKRFYELLSQDKKTGDKE